MRTGSYFHLHPDCLLVTGAVNGALYHLDEGSVYAVDREGRLILEPVDRGEPIQQIVQELRGVETRDKILEFLQKLERLGVGRFSSESAPPEKISFPKSGIHLEKIWLELEEGCNLNCIHCYAGSAGRTRCGGEGVNTAKWCEIIAEAAGLGARWLQLIGGEPLLAGRNKLFTLISAARKARYPQIEVFTNGTLLDEEHIDFFATNEVHVALSIYSRTPEIHDSITGQSGSFARVMGNVSMLRNRGVPVRFGLVVMDRNRSSETETVAWLRDEFADAHVAIDVIRGAPGQLSPELWQRRLRCEPLFSKVTRHSFARNCNGHSCLQGSLCVHQGGSVYPCIMDRSTRLGSVLDDNLGSILKQGETDRIWHHSKDLVSGCRDCEFRYACFDCPPLNDAVTNWLDAERPPEPVKDPCCLYDPNRGEWGDPEAFMQMIARKANCKASGAPPERKEVVHE